MEPDGQEKFGGRILRLAEAKGLSLAALSRETGIPYRTLNRWIGLDAPPRARDRVHRLEEILGGSLLEPGEVPLQIKPEYRKEHRRYAQPLDYRKMSLDATGRARHYLARILAALEDPDDAEVDSLVEMLREADHELADAQQHLLGRIEINDKGKKV